MAVYKTDANKQLVKTAGNASSGLPVGAIFPSAIPLTDARVHLLDGSTISQTGVYADFANLIKTLISSGYNISCSETEFNNDVSATGNCGKFVVDNTSGTIRLPKITTFIQGLSSITNIGDSLSAGLPNITGVMNNNWTSSASYSGALYLAGTGSANRASTGSGNAYNMGIDASRSNSIYGNSNTVQPNATQFPYYIVLASGYKSTGAVNIDNIMSDLNNKQDKIKLLWERAISSMAETTITLNSSDYDFLVVLYTEETKPMGSIVVPKGQDMTLRYSFIGFWNTANDTTGFCYRDITYVNDTTLTIGEGKCQYWVNGVVKGNKTYTSNAKLVPYKILGVKL